MQERPGDDPRLARLDIIERVHRTMLDEHFCVEGRKTWLETSDKMQKALDAWLLAQDAKQPKSTAP